MLTRRQFLETLIAGSAILACKNVFAYPDQFLLSREEFYEFLRQPVRESLQDTRVQFVTQEEYDGVVNQTTLSPEERRPVMALIYCDSQQSRGLAALVYTWDRTYPEMKQVAVCFNNSAIPSQRVVNDTCRRFSMQGLPGLIAYRKDGERIVRADQMDGGISVYSTDENAGCYLSNLAIFQSFIEEQLLGSR